jgi:sugar/nucleoside kinase (ribokinase family)
MQNNTKLAVWNMRTCKFTAILPKSCLHLSGTEVEVIEAVQERLVQWCRVSVVTLGPEGCVARGADCERGYAAARKVHVMDTLSAGDYFTSGFLYAYLKVGR